MRVDVAQYVKNIRANRKLRHRIAAFLTAMSMAVSMTVFWQLRGVGTAMEEDIQTCSQQEHSHTDKCYDKVLVCQNTDSGHEHTGDCYEDRLICGLDEHTHSSTCTADKTADTETEAVWEQTLPKELGENVRENIALIAQSQLGYSESKTNFHIADDGETKNGYTRYGQWYGSPYGEWNSLFTYFCMYYAGVDRQSVPYGSGTAAWAAELEKKKLVQSIKDTTLQKGDVILIDTDLDDKADRSAVVTQLIEQGGKTQLEAIQGNVRGSVAKSTYQLDDKHIIGCVKLDGAAGEMLFEQVSASGVRVTAKADKGTFPENTTMTVTDIEKSEAVKTAQQGIGTAEKVVDAVAVDITFKNANGEEIEPAKSKNVTVQISLTGEKKLEGDNQKLLHKTDNGEVKAVENAKLSPTQADFTADSFSIYVMTSTGKLDIDQATRIRVNKPKEESVNNTTDRYVFYVGEEIEVFAPVGEDTPHNWESVHFTVSENGAEGSQKLIRTLSDTFTSSGELTAKYRAMREGNCSIQFTENGVTESFNITVKNAINLSTPLGTLPSGPETFFLLNKSFSDPKDFWLHYVYYLGDEIEFSIIVPQSSTDSFEIRNNNDNTLTLVPESLKQEDIGNGMKKVSVRYKATQVGTNTNTSFNYTEVKFADKKLYAEVKFPVFVNSSLGVKNIDMVNEWLDGMGLPKQNGYIPNSISQQYIMHVGDTIELFADDASAVFSNNTITYERTAPNGTDVYTKTGDADYNAIEQISQNAAGTGDSRRVTVKYEAKAAGLAEVAFGDKRTVYIRVIDNDSEGKYTHADIEISDGGKYSHTTVEYQGGKKVATVKVYDSYITAVNRCILYDKNGDVIVPTLENGSPTGDGNDVSFVPGDYYQNGQPGQPQYELTSQYKIVNGNSISSAKRYKGSDVNTALFDVKLTLKPSHQFTITTEGGVETVSDPVELTGEDMIIDNSLFFMNHQDVIDASNKCPNHTGLDFTIRASMALTQVEAIKSLKGGTLNGDDFEFEIVDGSGMTVATALNAANGEIRFDNLHFETAGTFDYVLKEVIPEQTGSIEYDPRTYDLHITVRDIGNGVMSAELDVRENEKYEFENKTKYTLPNTGGAGILPHLTLGSGLMLTAFVLLRKKRKEGG